MKAFLTIFALLITVMLAGCNRNNSDINGTENKKDEDSQIETTPQPSQEEKDTFSSLWEKAIDVNTVFKFNDIDCKVLKAGSNMSYIGCDFNENTNGVHIYIEYSPGLVIDQDNFVVLDKNLEIYTHITADGLDYLGKNRGELGEDINGEPRCGFIRIALPADQERFLLRYEDSNGFKYIKFTVEEEWEQ